MGVQVKEGQEWIVDEVQGSLGCQRFWVEEKSRLWWDFLISYLDEFYKKYFGDDS